MPFIYRVSPDQDFMDAEYKDSEGRDDEHRIALNWTAVNFGGERPWFLCPVAGCQRRAAILCLVHGQFMCRNCAGLAYQSQHKDPEFRKLQRANKIRQRLGGASRFQELIPEKPKGMHWQTYLPLVETLLELETEAFEEISESRAARLRALDVWMAPMLASDGDYPIHGRKLGEL